MPSKPTIWTPELLDRLREMWEVKNMSAREIAEALFGDGSRRNSVIGAAHRANFRVAGTRPTRTPADKPRPPPQRKPAVRLSTDPATQGPTGWRPADDELWTAAQARVHLLDLQPRHCRWPVGGQYFCGGDAPRTHANPSYCSAHARIAFRPSPPRNLLDVVGQKQ